jgi:hypothetical protein
VAGWMEPVCAVPIDIKLIRKDKTTKIRADSAKRAAALGVEYILKHYFNVR